MASDSDSATRAVKPTYEKLLCVLSEIFRRQFEAYFDGKVQIYAKFDGLLTFLSTFTRRPLVHNSIAKSPVPFQVVYDRKLRYACGKLIIPSILL